MELVVRYHNDGFKKCAVPGIRIGWSCLCLDTSPTHSAFQWRQRRTHNPRSAGPRTPTSLQITEGKHHTTLLGHPGEIMTNAIIPHDHSWYFEDVM
jgi:hypothetical protein